MSSIVGTNGAPYVLGKQIARGTEGDIYPLSGKPDHLAKIYRGKDLGSNGNTRIKNKLEYMLRNPIERPGANCPTFAWPVDALYSPSGNIVGYVMPKMTDMQCVVSVYTPTERRRLFSSFTWKHDIYIARNIAYATASLHSLNIVKGDWNPKDILVNPQCRVSFIDCDSFDLSLLAGNGFKCIVYTPELLAPELWGTDPKAARYTKQTDCFSLAVILFQLLMGGFHPFSAPVPNSPNPIAENIANGRCPYVSSSIRTPSGAPDPRALPADINALFYRCFAYTKEDVRNGNAARRRPTAAEWTAALDKLIADLNSKSVAVCPKGHVHLHAPWLKGSYNGCPFCEQAARDKDMRSSRARLAANAAPMQRSANASGQARPAMCKELPTTEAWKGTSTEHARPLSMLNNASKAAMSSGSTVHSSFLDNMPCTTPVLFDNWDEAIGICLLTLAAASFIIVKFFSWALGVSALFIFLGGILLAIWGVCEALDNENEPTQAALFFFLALVIGLIVF